MLNFRLLLIILVFLPCYQLLQCLDEDNRPVDWFIVYKFPEIPRKSSGFNYNFLTNNSYQNWQLSTISINDSRSIIGNTLNFLYADKQENFAYIAYNDQPPNSPSHPNKGHTKGVLATDTNSGFWLIHSVPHFPNLTQLSYNFPENGLVYGQSFLCITLNTSTIDQISIQLQYNEPQIFAHKFPETFNENFTELHKLIGGKTVKTPPWFRKIPFKSTGNFNYFSFAKSGKFNKDLYEDWLAPDLQHDLFVESWLNGHGKLPSNCSKPFKVFNIESVNIATDKLNFTSTHDHSKWAITVNSNTSNWICIGDINRMEHQKTRGGGTVCFQHKKLHQNYKELVSAIEECIINL